MIYRSSGAYEFLRESGCIKLPSQRTLRDYTHHVQASPGFSTEVDQMLMKAAGLGSCSQRDKCTILILDEMYIRQDLVYDKHTGNLIGFTSLGDIGDHLSEFERSLAEGATTLSGPRLAKTIYVFMVRGLFNKLQFPYAQFPCSSVTAQQLYDPFWEAVERVERCGLMVSWQRD